MEISKERQEEAVNHLTGEWRKMPCKTMGEYLAESNVPNSPPHYKITGKIRVIDDGDFSTLYRIFEPANPRNIAEFSMPKRSDSGVEDILSIMARAGKQITFGARRGNLRSAGTIEYVSTEEMEAVIF